MNQLALRLNPPSVRDSRTSAQAADGIRGAANALRQRVLDLLRARASTWDAGMTDEEMQVVLEMNPSTQRPRRGELVALGLVVDSGRTRSTRSGRQATVWVAR